MKKILLAIIVVAGIAACNSPQQMTTSNGDSTSTMAPSTTDTSGMMQGDTMKRDSMR